MKFRAPVRGLVIVLAAIGLACEWPTDARRSGYPAGVSRLPEDRGELVAVANGYGLSGPEWTQAGRLYFEGMTDNITGPKRFSLSTLPPESKSSTQLLDFGTNPLFSVTTSPDTSWVYVGVVSGGPTPPSLLRVRAAGDSSELVTSRLNWALTEYFGATVPVMASPNGASVAYTVIGESLFVLTAATGASRFVSSGCTRLAAISPKSDTIVCNGRDGYRLVDLNTGGSTALAVSNAAAVTDARRFRWDSAGIHIVHGRHTDIWVTDLKTQTTKKAPFDSTQGVLDIGRVAWSGDGRSIAWWSWWCLDFGLNSCDAQYGLNVLSLDTWTVRRVAVVNASGGVIPPGRVALDHRGETVAYVFGNGLYIKPIPPP